MIMNKVIVTAMLSMFILFSDLQAKVHIWMDEKGITHFSSQAQLKNEIQSPPPDENNERETGKIIQNKSPGNRIRIPGTQVALVSPPGFKMTDRFPGFVHQETNSSIMITKIPGPYPEMVKDFTKAGFSSRGMKLIEKKNVTICGKESSLFNIAQTADGARWEKWVLVVGIQNETILLTATFPQQLRTKLSNPMRTSLLSTQCILDADEEPLAGLCFSVSSKPNMKFAKRIGNSIIMTKDGGFPAKNKTDPFIFAGPSVSEGAMIEDKKALAIQRAQEIKMLKDIEIQDVNNITIDGLNGYEITAKGTHRLHGEITYAYQVVLFGRTDYFIIAGYVTVYEKAKYWPIFRKIALSFKQKQSQTG